MNSTEIKEKLTERLKHDLPRQASHIKVAVSSRLKNIKNKHFQPPSDARQSAVLIHLFPDENEQIHFPLILRNTYDGVHSNQVGLPGGKLEAGENHLKAALREFEEEMGYQINESKVLGSISSIYIPPSNFNMLPFISVSEHTPSFTPDPTEVAEIILCPLAELLNAEIVEKEINVRDGIMTVLCFIIQGKIVWGATAAVLSELKDVMLEIYP